MEQENPEGFDRPTESISEIIEEMYFAKIRNFRPDGFGLEDMKSKYKDEVFWYVYDQTKQHVVAHRVKNKIEPVTYLFQEKADAEEWRWIGTKSGTHSRDKLIVVSDKFSTIAEMVEDTLGEFEVLAISHAEAQNVFENYPELKLTREVEERRKENPSSQKNDDV